MLQVALQPYLLRFKRPAPTSRGALTTRQIYLLRAWDSETPWVAGWGECGPLPGLSRDDRPDFGAAIHAACANFNTTTATYESRVTSHAARITQHLPSFAFALETALLDLAAGGRQQLWPTPFSRGETGLPTHGLIWMDTPAALLQQIQAKVAQGCRAVKLKVGALPFAEEVELLARIRANYPAASVELRLDANGAFTPEDALAKLDALARFEIAFLEQPIRAGQWPALAHICHQSPIPIALDEELIPICDEDERRRLLDTVQPQHLILKPALLGGFAACNAWIEAAQVCGVAWWGNSLLEANIGLNAICQWIAQTGGERIHGLGTGQLFTNNIPSPLRTEGCALHADPARGWVFPNSA